MKKTKHHHITTRGLAYALSFMLVFTSIDFSVISYAGENEEISDTDEAQVSESYVITGFEALPEEALAQEVLKGDEEDSIQFPTELKMQVEKTITKEEIIPDDAAEDASSALSSIDETAASTDASDETGASTDASDETGAGTGASDDTGDGTEPSDDAATGANTGEGGGSSESGEGGETGGGADPGNSGNTGSNPDPGTPTPSEDENNGEPVNSEPATGGGEPSPGESTPQSTEGGDASDLGARLIDGFRDFGIMRVYAAEPGDDPDDEPDEPDENPVVTTGASTPAPETPTPDTPVGESTTKVTTEVIEETVTLTEVEWKINEELSSETAFSSEKVGDVFVYEPVFPENYTLKDEVEAPKITVTIVAGKKFVWTEVVDGVTVTLTADPGVFPEDSYALVKRVGGREEEIADKVSGIYSDEDAEHRSEDTGMYGPVNVFLVDITVYDKDGKEVQPDTTLGKVVVTFSGEKIASSDEEHTDLFRVEEDGSVTMLESEVDAGSGVVSGEAEHFTLYGVSSTGGSSSGTFSVGSDKNLSAESLVAHIIEGNYTADNINEVMTNMKRTGTVYTFSNGGSAVGLSEGIVLDTSGNISGGQDAQLDGMRGSYSYGGDTSSLEFETIVPINGNMLNFNYVFASGEFNQNPRYNDVFGLFVSVNGGAWKNIAKITRNNGSQVDVNITNLRAGKSGSEMSNGTSTSLSGSHSLFTNKSISPISTNGVSNVFNAQMAVNPGDKVKVKMAVADISDRAVNSYVFIEAQSLSFQYGKRITYYDSDNVRHDEPKVDYGSSVKLPKAELSKPKDGYAFVQWNTKKDGTGTAYKAEQSIVLEENLIVYPIFAQIKNTAEVKLTLDGSAWSSQKVELYRNYKSVYTLAQTTAGTYTNGQVLNGTYDIYVNGADTGKDMVFNATKISLKISKPLPYYTAKVITRLDDVNSSTPGTVLLRQNGTTKYTGKATNGVNTWQIQTDAGAFDIFVGGNDTDFNLEYKQGDSSSYNKTVDFHTVEITITDESAYKTAKVELRDAAGNILHRLNDVSETNATTAKYTKILQENTTALDLFVDGNKTTEQIRSVSDNAGGIDRKADLTFYTVKVNITCSDKEELFSTSISDGRESYILNPGTLSGTTRPYTIEHVYQRIEAEEVPYTVTMEGVTTTGAEILVNKTDKVANVTVRILNYYSYHETGTNTGVYQLDSDPWARTFVQDGVYATAPAEPYMAGFTFSGWSTTQWTKGSKNPTFAFASTQIKEDMKFYAQFLVPTVEINGYVRTNVNGVLTSNGTSYRMANLSISGFDPSDDASSASAQGGSIKYIIFDHTNTTALTCLAGASGSVGNNCSFVFDADNSRITFNGPTPKSGVSMATAQQFIRDNIVVTPNPGETHTMKVTVIDKNGTTAESGSISYAQSGTGYTTLTNSINNLANGSKYIVSSNVTYNTSLRINSGATVYIYIPAGKTLRVTGENGSGRTGGKAGIYVPSNATLILMGEGSVIATGGNAGNATNGSSNSSNAKINQSGSKVTSGSGGSGGNGGGGAGAGIGGDGGQGGAGGSGGSSVTVSANSGSSSCHNGNNGGNGGSGSSGSTCGTVYILGKLNVTAKGGSAGSAGNGGTQYTTLTPFRDNNNGGYAVNDGGTGWSSDHGAGPGGGGGGGGAGQAGSAIGGGGAGGGGGGGGASGGTAAENDVDGNYTESNVPRGGGGGGGASQIANGGSGGGSRTSAHGFSTSYGGYGGSSGASGSKGGNGTNYVATTAQMNNSAGSSSQTNYPATTYTITFTGSYGTPSKASATYTSGTATTITLPNYTPDSSHYFRYWVLTGYGVSVSGNTSNLLTKADNGQKYKQGQKISCPSDTAGNLTFTAIVGEKSGLTDDSEILTVNALNANTATTYYTYNINTTINGTADNVGTATINGKQIAGNKGVYSYVSDKKLTSAQVGGVNVTLGGLNNNNLSTTNVAFQTIRVKVTGYKPGSVVLVGGAALSLASEDAATKTYIYETTYKKSGSDTSDYTIQVDGKDVSTQLGVYGKYGQIATVPFYTTTLTVNTNGMTAEEVGSAYMVPAGAGLNGVRTYLNQQSASGNTAVYTITRLKEESDQYDLYVDDTYAGSTTDFTQDHSFTFGLNRFTTKVIIRKDNSRADIGTVRLVGDSTLFSGNATVNMVRVEEGEYQFISNVAGNVKVTVDGRDAVDSFAIGGTTTIDFYTVTYLKAGQDVTEAGDVPVDENIYQKGQTATILDQGTLTNAGKTFDGWRIGSTLYNANTSSKTFTVNDTIKPIAVWSRTSLTSDKEVFNVILSGTDYVYNGMVQKPDVVVKRGAEPVAGSNDEPVITLVEGQNYKLSYKNSNTQTGREKNDGSTSSAIDAGTVTITITGINDYTGSFTVDYAIHPKTIQVEGLKAVNREYNGTTRVDLTTATAKLYGAVEGDDVNLSAATYGDMFSSRAGMGKEVDIGTVALAGTHKSDYVMKEVEPVMVDIYTKTLTDAMVSIAPTTMTYDGSELKPQVTLTDLNAHSENIISENDVQITYADNVHVGTGTVTVCADIFTQEEINQGVVPNYTGTIVKTFTIVPAQVTFRAQAQTSAYDEIVNNVTTAFTTEGTIAEDDLSAIAPKGVTTVKQGDPAGLYENAVAVEYTPHSDYQITAIPADYTITKKGGTPTLSTQNTTYLYDATDHTIRYSVSAKDAASTHVYFSATEITDAIFASSVVNGEPKNESGITKDTAVAFKDAGVHTVWYYAVSDNYNAAATGSATVTITKKAISVATEPRTIVYGQSLTDLVDTRLISLTFTGLIAGDQAEIDKYYLESGAVTYSSGNYYKGAPVGTYQIMPTITDDAMEDINSILRNYEVTGYAGADLVVTKRPIPGFTWEGSDGTTEGTNGITMSYTGSEQGVVATPISSVQADGAAGVLPGDNVIVSEYATGTYTEKATATGTYKARVSAVSGADAGNYYIDEADKDNYVLAGNTTLTGAEVNWKITKSTTNAWTLKPTIQGWTSGNAVATPASGAVFGSNSVQYSYIPYSDLSISVAENSADYEDALLESTLAYLQDNTALTGAELETAVANLDADTHYVLFAQIAETTDYNGLTGVKKFTVNHKPTGEETSKTVVYVTPENVTLTYGQSIEDVKQTITVHYTYGENSSLIDKIFRQPVDGITGTLTYTTNYNTSNPLTRGVGTYQILLGGVTSNVYELVFVPGTVTVYPRNVDLTWTGSDGTNPGTDGKITLSYTGAPVSVVASVGSNQLAYSADKVSVGSYSNNTKTEANTYNAQALTLVGADAANYNIASSTASATWVIGKAANAWTTDPIIGNWYYGDTPAAPKGAARFGEVKFYYKKDVEFKLLDPSTWFNRATTDVPTQVGSYKMYAVVDEGPNYTGLKSYEGESATDENTTTFKILPAEVNVTALNQTGNYPKAADNFKTTNSTNAEDAYTCEVFRGTVSYDDKAALQIAVSCAGLTNETLPGAYPITVSYVENSNITMTTYPATYTVGRTAISQEQTAAASEAASVTVAYDGTGHTIAAPVIKDADGNAIVDSTAKIYYSASTINNANYIQASTVAPSYTDAGVYPVNYYIASDNFENVSGTAILTIEKRPLTVKADDKSIAYGDAAPAVTVTYTNLVEGDGPMNPEAAIVEKLVDGYGSPYTVGSNVGEYAIRLSGLTDNNYTYNYVDGILTVGSRALTESDIEDLELTLSPTSYVYDVEDGTATGISYTPEVSYHDAAGNTRTVDSSDPNFTVTYLRNNAAGEATARITPKAGGCYSGSAIDKAFTISPKAVVLTANSGCTAGYNQTMPDVSAEYTVTSANLNDAEKQLLELEAVTNANKGSAIGSDYALTVSYKKNSNYNVTVNDAVFEVTKAIITVTATNYDWTYDGKDHEVGVEAKTGNWLANATPYYSISQTLADSLSESDVNALVSEGKATRNLKLKDAGNYTVSYYVCCGTNYEIETGTFNVTIRKAPLTVTLPEIAAATYGMTKAEALGGITKESLSIDGFMPKGLLTTPDNESCITFPAGDFLATSYDTGSSVGNYEVKAAGLSAANYDFIYEPATLTVQPAEVSLGWPEGRSFTYNGKEQQITATITSGLLSEDTGKVFVASYAGNKASAVGEYTAQAKALSGDKAENYVIGSGNSAEWSIVRGTNIWTIEPAISGWVEGMPAAEPMAAARSGAPVTFTYSENADGTYAAAKPTEAGSYFMKAYVPETVNYDSLTSNPVPFTITAHTTESEDITTYYVKAENRSFTYAGNTMPDQDGYTWSVTKADPQSGGYTEVAATLADCTETARPVFTTNYNESGSRSGIGIYDIVPSGLTPKDANTRILYRSGTLTVNAKTISLTWTLDHTNVDSVVYDGNAHVVDAIAETGVLDGDTITVSGYTGKLYAVEKGDYTAEAVTFRGNGWNNYVIDSSSAEFTWHITQAAIGGGEKDNHFTSGPSIDDWTYGDAASTPVVEAKYGTPQILYYTDTNGTKTGAANGVATAGGKPSAAGSYYMRATVTATDNYAGLDSGYIPFAIGKRNLTVIVNDASSVYQQPISDLSYTSNGLLEEDESAITISPSVVGVTSSSAAGTYDGAIKATVTGTKVGNYNVTVIPGTYYVTRKGTGISITAEGNTAVYDGEGHGISVSVTGDTSANVYFSNTLELDETNYAKGEKVPVKKVGANYVAQQSASAPKNAGNYTVYYYVESTNYAGVAGSKEVVIEKAPLTVKAVDQTITYGDALPMSSASVTYNGFMPGDNKDNSGITGEITYTYTYAPGADVGTYVIEPQVSDLSSPNYTFTPATGVLTVEQKEISFDWSMSVFEYDGTRKSITATPVGMVGSDAGKVTVQYKDSGTNTYRAVNVGNYVATVQGLLGSKAGNYTFGSETSSKNWSIKQVFNLFTIEPAMEGWVYGETPSELSGKGTFGATTFVYTDQAGNELSDRPTKPGAYFVLVTTEDTANYIGVSRKIGFVIEKAVLNLEAKDNYTAVNNDLEALTFTVNDSEAISSGTAFTDGAGEVITATLKTTADKTVAGQSAITFDSIKLGEGGEATALTIDGDVAETDYYTLKLAEGTYTVSANGLKVGSAVTGAEGAEIVYDGQYHTISVIVKDADGNDLSAPSDYQIYYSDTEYDTKAEIIGNAYTDPSTFEIRDVGSRRIYYYVIKNSEIIKGHEDVVITKKPITIKANDAECYRGKDPVNNGAVYSGFVNGEDESFLDGTLTFFYEYDNTMPAGEYDIIPTGLDSTNYLITYQAGKLTVKEYVDLAQAIESGALKATDFVYDGSVHTTAISLDGTELHYLTDYVLTQGSRSETNVGAYPIKITGQGIYGGNAALTWNIFKAPQTRPVQGEGYTITPGPEGKVVVTNTNPEVYGIYHFVEHIEDGVKTMVLEEIPSGTEIDDGDVLYVRKEGTDDYAPSSYLEVPVERNPKVTVHYTVEPSVSKTAGTVTMTDPDTAVETVLPDGSVVVSGKSLTVTAQAADGYEFSSWKISRKNENAPVIVPATGDEVESHTFVADKDMTVTAVFTYVVPEDEEGNPTQTLVHIPTATPVEFDYDGDVHGPTVTPVVDGEEAYYTVTDSQKTEAGYYVLIVSLNEAPEDTPAYVWEDGTTTPKKVNWLIRKKASTLVPELLVRDTPGGEEGEKEISLAPTQDIDGNPYHFEYSTDGGKTWEPVPSNGIIPDVDEDTVYLVREAGDENHEPGKAKATSIGTPLTVKTNPPKVLNSTEATLSGVTSVSVSAELKGFEYRVKSGGSWIVLTDAAIAVGADNTFSSELENLTEKTVYEARAFGINQSGKTIYGETMTFKTPAVGVATGSISVTVENLDGEEIDYIVTVEEGNDAIASKSGTTGANTNKVLSFQNLPDGNYNIVVKREDGKYTETRMLTVRNGGNVSAVFRIPQIKGELTDVVEIKGSGTPSVAVDGLPEIIEMNQDEVLAAAKGEKNIEVKLQVERDNSPSDYGVVQIQNILDPTVHIDMFLDITLLKTVTELDAATGLPTSVSTTNLGNSNSIVLKIAIPFSRANPVIYRCHENQVSRLTKLGSEPSGGYQDGTFYIGDSFVYLYASQFSIYALGYEEEIKPASSPSTSSGDEPTESTSDENKTPEEPIVVAKDTTTPPQTDPNANEDKKETDNNQSEGQNVNSSEQKDKEPSGNEDQTNKPSDEDKKDSKDDNIVEITKTEISDTVPENMDKKDKQNLDDAIEQINKLTGEDKKPTVIGYVQVPEDAATDENGKAKISFDIPESFLKDREEMAGADGADPANLDQFYLVAVDPEGNIILVPNASIVDGKLLFDAEPGYSYELIYDEADVLGEMRSEDGKLLGTDGKPLSINGIHFILFDLLAMLITLALGILAILKRKKWGFPTTAICSVVSVILWMVTVKFGSMRFFGAQSIWFALILLVGAAIIFVKKRAEQESEEKG